jgi:hypothetical protein
MKKITLLLLVFVSAISFAQQGILDSPQDVDKKQELKLNAFSLIAFSSLDASYEYLLNKDSSFGVSVFYNFGSVDNDVYFPRKFSITPYYRWFFTESRFARGFFVEGFGMLNTYEDEVYLSDFSYKVEKETGFALGISVGGKFVIKSGFTAEISLGVGRNLFSNNDIVDYIENSIVTRGGVSLGYRF